MSVASFLVGCNQSPTRIVNSCGFKVIPTVSDSAALNTPGVFDDLIEQINNNQELHDLCMRGLDG